MDKLKIVGGPFTNSDMVQEYMDDSDVAEKEKQKRLKLEMQFARESSTSLPQIDPLFKIQITLPTKKRREKTADEFAESLMAYLGKKSEIATMDYSKFKLSLTKYSDREVVDDCNNKK